MAVDIQFAGDLSLHKNRDYDFRLGFERAGEVARILADVVHHDGFAAGGGGAADALVQRYASVRRHRPDKRVQHQYRRLRAGFQHVEADPVVFEHALVQYLAHAMHEFFRSWHRTGQLRDLVTNLFDPG